MNAIAPVPAIRRLTRDPAKRRQIERIARRYMALLHAHKIRSMRDAIDYEIDLCMVVGSGITFDLDTLERFGDDDFAHDMGGIEEHLNRQTGQLERCFLPRASRPDYIAIAHAED